MLFRKVIILIAFVVLSLCACSKGFVAEKSNTEASLETLPDITVQRPEEKQEIKQEAVISPKTELSTSKTNTEVLTPTKSDTIANQTEIPKALPSGDITPKTIEDAEKLYDKGFNLYMQFKYDDAIEYCNKALKTDKNFFKAYNLKGIALCFKGNYTEGMQLIQTSIDIKADYGYSNFNMAMAYKLQKDYDNALIWFNKAILLDPKDVWSYYGISTIYADRDQIEKSLEYLKQAITLDTSVKDVARKQDHFIKMRKDQEFINLIE